MSMLGKVAGVLVFGLVLSGAGCHFTHCEHGAVCEEDEDERRRSDDEDVGATCVAYCARLSLCGAPQAEDFDACVQACEQRFEVLPERTREVCECAEWSRCSDVVEGRCTEPAPAAPPSGAGGACPLPNGSCNAAGSSGAGGTAAGAPTHAGGASSGAGAAGPCTAACDCAAGESCVDGLCTRP